MEFRSRYFIEERPAKGLLVVHERERTFRPMGNPGNRMDRFCDECGTGKPKTETNDAPE